MSLQLQLERDRLAPGDWISGTVYAHAAVQARSLAVYVTLFESTRSFTEEVLTGWTGFLHQGVVPERSSFPFRLQLPPSVPPPYRSEWGELHWEVDAKADVPSGIDAHAKQRILVLPPGVSEESLVHPGSIESPGIVPGTLAAAGAAITGSAPESGPSASSAPGSFPAGWHADPWLEKRLRWWDGNGWTGHTAD